MRTTAEKRNRVKVPSRLTVIILTALLLVVFAVQSSALSWLTGDSDRYITVDNLVIIDSYGSASIDESDYYCTAYYVNSKKEIVVVSLIVDGQYSFYYDVENYLNDENMRINDLSVSGTFPAEYMADHEEWIISADTETVSRANDAYYETEDRITSLISNYCEENGYGFVYSDYCIIYVDDDSVVTVDGVKDIEDLDEDEFAGIRRFFWPAIVLFLLFVFSRIRKSRKNKQKQDKGHECYGQFSTGDYEQKAGYSHETYTVDKNGNVQHSGDCYGQYSQGNTQHTVNYGHTATQNNTTHGHTDTQNAVHFARDKEDPDERTPFALYGRYRTCRHCGSPVSRFDYICEDCGGRP